MQVDTNIIKEWLTYNEPLKFEIIFSNSGVARIYIGDRKTGFYSGGYGYDKSSAVVANFINELIGKQNYNKELYGNRNGKLSSGGVGMSSLETSFNSLCGCKLEQIYSGVNGYVYSLKVNKRIKDKIKVLKNA